MKEGSIKKQPVSEHQDKGKGAQQWLACGGRGKINLIVRTDSHLKTVWPRKDGNPALVQKGKCKGYPRIRSKGKSLLRLGKVVGLR